MLCVLLPPDKLALFLQLGGGIGLLIAFTWLALHPENRGPRKRRPGQ